MASDDEVALAAGSERCGINAAELGVGVAVESGGEHGGEGGGSPAGGGARAKPGGEHGGDGGAGSGWVVSDSSDSTIASGSTKALTDSSVSPA